MSEKKAYVAYAGTYTNGTSKGIHIYDVDVDEGLLFLRKVIPLNNSSYITRSKDMKFLYSIADEGVRAFRIQPDGDLKPINEISINGMRGCHMSVDLEGKYLFVAGYHDGKVTVVKTKEDGRLDSLMTGVFHKGMGAVNERCFRPHVCCVRVTPDNQFLCAVDFSLDQIFLYKIDEIHQRLVQIDTIRMGREAGPRSLHFSKDGRFAYLLCEIINKVRVYRYSVKNGYPVFELVQEIKTLKGTPDPYDAGSALRLSYDGRYVFCSTSGDNSVCCFEVDRETGLLTRLFSLPTSGIYPKDVALFPDQKHIAVVNNGSGTITTFGVDYEKKTIAMKGKPQKLDTPNCIVFQEIEKAPDVILNLSEKEAEALAGERKIMTMAVSLEDDLEAVLAEDDND